MSTETPSTTSSTTQPAASGRHRVVVIPKSTDEGRIEANLAATGLALSDEEVARIDGLAGPH